MTTLNDRFAEIVSRKLGVVAVWTRDIRNRDGSDTPVFRVPVDAIARAKAFGLTVEEDHDVSPARR